MRGPLLIAFVAGSCGAARTGVPGDPDTTALRLPSPYDLGAPLTVNAGGGEVVRRVGDACSRYRVDGESWTRVLTDAGYLAQAGGWSGEGPVAIRFRHGLVVGDVFATSSHRRGDLFCRTVVLRAQRLASVNALPVRWSWRFGGHGRSGFCRELFAPDPSFPAGMYESGAYSWCYGAAP
jgi:hypothetical protein